MNHLYRFVRHPVVYKASSAVLVLLVMAVVAWKTDREIDAELHLSQLRTLGSYSATLEGGTTNSRAMGAAILFGRENQEAKQVVMGKLPPDAPKVNAALDMLRELYTAEIAFLVNKQGIIVAYSGKGNVTGVGRDISFRPYVQQALKGTPSVYPAVGIIYPDRGIFLSAPLYASANETAEPSGAVVIKIGADKLDMLLKSWTGGIAVLLSPQGVVFASNRDDWLFHATGAMSAERLADIRRTRQFGKSLDQAPPPSVPFSLDMSETTIDGQRYAVGGQPLEWNDPEGDWQLTLLERRDPWWTHGSVLGFAALAGLITAWVLFWFYTLTRNALLLENMNAQLRHNDALLQESQSIAGLGFYTLDIASGNWESSDVLDSLFGIERTYEHTIEGWLALVHPDDRAMMQRYYSDEVVGLGRGFDKEYRIIRSNDRAERWVHALGKLERDGQGRLAKMRGTIQDITARKRYEQEIQKAMHELEQKELAKSRFLAAAGHDLRQPLAAANLFIDALKSTSPSAGQNQIIQRLDQAMATFNGLLETLLNISRLDAGIIRPEYTSISVDELFIWLENSFAGLASEKKLGFRLYFPMREMPTVRGDIGLVKSVLMNLVSNAIKFTQEGAILVSARRRGNGVLFQVWDTGMGIPPEYMGHIYDEFYQVNNLQRDRARGLGLGLAIARRALALMGAEISCRSRPGHGTVFEFLLPMVGSPKTGASRVATPASQGTVANAGFAQGKRFVVVEDDAIVAQAIICVLEGIGGEVQRFHNAEDALRDADVASADYFIADYMLAGKLNGIQFLNQVRQRLGKPINAVLMTGDTSPSFLAESQESAWTVLHKPINLTGLLAGLRAHE
jgi:signal transduction histidine kinase/CheY-like chemotaxis protein